MSSSYLNQFSQISKKESQIILLASIAAIIYAITALSIHYYQLSNLYFQMVYIASVLVLPLVLFYAYSVFIDKESGYLNSAGKIAFLANAIMLGLSTSYTVLGTSLDNFISLFMVYGCLALLLMIFYQDKIIFYIQKLEEKKFFELLLYMSFFSLFIFVSCAFVNIFYVELSSITKGLIQLQAYQYITLRVSVGIFIAIGFIYIFFAKKVLNVVGYKKLTLLVSCSPILLIDAMNVFDIEHYNAYLAPAIAVLNGKIPLIDVFCHYGLSYLVFTIAYLFMPNNYAIAGLIVSGLNVVCWITLLLMLRAMVKNPVYFTVLAISSVFGINYMFGHSLNISPSALCMRYLPSIIFAYVLLISIDSKKFQENANVLFKRLWFNALMLINAFWSVESLCSMIVMYVGYQWLGNTTWRLFFNRVAGFFAWIFFVYLVFYVIYFICFKQFPNYSIYLNYIYDYMNPYHKIGDRFLLVDTSVYQDSFLWIIFATTQLVCFFYFLRHRFFDKETDIYHLKVLFLNIVATVFLVYFILQGSFVTMMISGYPALMLFLSVLVLEKEKTKSDVLRVFSSASLCVISFVFFTSGLNVLSVEYKDFFKQGDLLYESFQHRGLSLDRFLYNLTHFCSKKEKSPGVGNVIAIEENTCVRNSHHEALKEAVNKWYPKEKEIWLFHRDLTEILIETHKVHKVLVSPVNDSVVRSLYEKVLSDALKKAKFGDVIIVEKDFNLFPIELAILKNISKVFNFKLLEETPQLKVFQLFNKDSSKKTDIQFPVEIDKITASINYYSPYEGPEPKTGIRALKDKDKETTWIVREDALTQSNIFWIILDLGQEFAIENVKIWRKIDFRIPEYFNKQSYGFIENFNIQLSVDKKNWFLSKSNHDFLIHNQNYVEFKLENQKARYIKLTVFKNNEKEFGISDIDVFGYKVE